MRSWQVLYCSHTSSCTDMTVTCHGGHAMPCTPPRAAEGAMHDGAATAATYLLGRSAHLAEIDAVGPVNRINSMLMQVDCSPKDWRSSV